MKEKAIDWGKVDAERLAIVKKIEEYERDGRFDEDVENDPEAPELLPDQVDYLCEKFTSRVKRRIANFIGDRYYQGLIKKGDLIIESVEGKEHFAALEKGAVVVCNHFSPLDNYIVFQAMRKFLPRKYLYKVIREGNYTNFPGLYGFLFRHCDTLPLSRNRRTMIQFASAVNTLLGRGEAVLIYPEQAMWWNYRKPRPFKVGAFKIAQRAGVPVLPIFITMRNDDTKLDKSGYPVQRHTVHVLPPVYPSGNAEATKDEVFALYQAKYKEIYTEE